MTIQAISSYTAAASHFFKLPAEMQLQILSYLKVQELGSLRLVSKTFRAIVDDGRVWATFAANLGLKVASREGVIQKYCQLPTLFNQEITNWLIRPMGGFSRFLTLPRFDINSVSERCLEGATVELSKVGHSIMWGEFPSSFGLSWLRNKGFLILRTQTICETGIVHQQAEVLHETNDRDLFFLTLCMSEHSSMSMPLNNFLAASYMFNDLLNMKNYFSRLFNGAFCEYTPPLDETQARNFKGFVSLY